VDRFAPAAWHSYPSPLRDGCLCRRLAAATFCILATAGWFRSRACCLYLLVTRVGPVARDPARVCYATNPYWNLPSAFALLTVADAGGEERNIGTVNTLPLRFGHLRWTKRRTGGSAGWR
jgi:hypothetical protein